MTRFGLLVRLEAQHGKDQEVDAFLRSAVPLVRAEGGTEAWFAIKFGRYEFGIFDAFSTEAARDAHLNGAVAAALMQNAATLLSEAPSIQKVDILADKLPAGAHEAITKGLLLTFEAKSGHEQAVEQFLLDAKPLVEQEPKTVFWFGLNFGGGKYGIFDVFPDNGGRFHHLTGHVPRELAKHALTLLGSVPDTHLPDIIAEK